MKFRNKIIKKEFDDFKKYHKNIYNVIFHIVCGFAYMSFFFSLFRDYKNIALSVYFLLLLMTVNLMSAVLICIPIYYIINNVISFSPNNIYIFLLFYFLPELSHYLTKEKTVLNIKNITSFSLFSNIFYLLPFSIQCLFNTTKSKSRPIKNNMKNKDNK